MWLVTFLITITKLTTGILGMVVVYSLISIFKVNILGVDMDDVETPLIPAIIVFYLGF